jgi:hypothetical protein
MGIYPVTSVFSTNSNDRHINEILLKVLSNFYDLKCLMFVSDRSVVFSKITDLSLTNIKHLRENSRPVTDKHQAF